MAAVVDWGSVSDWVSGVATVVAVVVALVFSLRAERHQRDLALAAVHAWFEVVPATPAAPARGSLRLVNDTAYPVYEWSVHVQWPDGPGDGAGLATGQGDHGLLPPGRHDFALDAADIRLPANDATVKVELRFRDAEGRMRRRLPTGKLVAGGR